MAGRVQAGGGFCSMFLGIRLAAASFLSNRDTVCFYLFFLFVSPSPLPLLLALFLPLCLFLPVGFPSPSSYFVHSLFKLILLSPYSPPSTQLCSYSLFGLSVEKKIVVLRLTAVRICLPSSSLSSTFSIRSSSFLSSSFLNGSSSSFFLFFTFFVAPPPSSFARPSVVSSPFPSQPPGLYFFVSLLLLLRLPL